MKSWRAIAGTLIAPVETFRALAEAPRTLLMLAFLVLAHLSVPAVLSSRIDPKQQVVSQLEMQGKLNEVTDRELDEQVTQAGKITVFATAAQGVFFPPLLSLGLTIVLWLWGRYLRGKPAFGVLYSLTTHAQLPLALRSLATAAVLLPRSSVTPGELQGILPSGLGGIVHAGPRLAMVLGGADLFLVWTAVLLGIALYAAGKLPPLRAAVGMGLAYAAFIAVFLVGLPGLGGAPHP